MQSLQPNSWPRVESETFLEQTEGNYTAPHAKCYKNDQHLKIVVRGMVMPENKREKQIQTSANVNLEGRARFLQEPTIISLQSGEEGALQGSVYPNGKQGIDE